MWVAVEGFSFLDNRGFWPKTGSGYYVAQYINARPRIRRNGWAKQKLNGMKVEWAPNVFQTLK
jgi:hypothetical protein